MALAPLAHVLWTTGHAPRSERIQSGPIATGSSCPAVTPRSSSTRCSYLTGYGLTLDDIKASSGSGAARPRAIPRSSHHRPRGHHRTAPVQGVANGVGMGLAERWLRARFGPELVDHLHIRPLLRRRPEEGISHEAGSLAVTSDSGRLIYVYDNNHISIDGPDPSSPYSDNVPERFDAYGWHTEDIGEVANDTEALEAGAAGPWRCRTKPSMISLRSHIVWPAPDVMDRPRRTGPPSVTRRSPRRRRYSASRRTRRSGSRRGPRLLSWLDDRDANWRPGVETRLDA